MPCRLAIASMSLGRACVHNFHEKLDQAARYGFEGIELFHEDLKYVARNLPGGLTDANQIEAAKIIRRLCDERNLTIIVLQPFMHYEGLLDREEHARRIKELKLWFRLAKKLGTNCIQIPSSFLPASQTTGDLDAIVADMIEVVDLGAAETPAINFAYEALAWGTHIDTWDAGWDIVERVARPNFGACLDTFNLAGRVYADPASPTGKTPTAEADLKASLERLVRRVDRRKVFFVQVVDAERLASPLVEGHPFYDAAQPARMSWSRNCRLFYGERDRGAYLPVREVADAFINGLGFEGWVSLELFHRVMADADPGVPAQLAQRGAESWRKLVRDLKLETGESKPAQTGNGTSDVTGEYAVAGVGEARL